VSDGASLSGCHTPGEIAERGEGSRPIDRGGSAVHEHGDSECLGHLGFGGAGLGRAFGVRRDAAVAHLRDGDRQGDEFLGLGVEGSWTHGRLVQFAERLHHVGCGVEDEAVVAGVDEGAFTRFPDTQIGGNVNPNVIAGKPRGIALDHGILDTSHPSMEKVPSWAESKLSDRADAAIVHEHIESTLTPPKGLSGKQAVDWLHNEAIRRAPDTTLPISDRARVILKEYRKAMGLE